MQGSLGGQRPEKDPDFKERPRFQLHGLLTGADAPTQAERVHLQDRGALLTLVAALAKEPAFWRDVNAIHDAIADVDWAAADSWRAATNPAWVRTLSYGVRGREHRVLVAAILVCAAGEPDRHAAIRMLQQLGERPVPLDGPPRGYARRDVTRLVEGAQAIAAFRAARCAVCGQPRRGGRYCRRHRDEQVEHRRLRKARLWTLDQAGAAVRPAGPLHDGEYAVWMVLSKADVAR
jgi:hypothetical protein